MSRAIVRQSTFAVIVFFLGLLVLEIGARALEDYLIRSAERTTGHRGWQAQFFGSLFDWHEPDPDLLWRFKAGLDNPLIRTSSDHLLGAKLPEEKLPGTYRILLLGDSSPVGLGLADRRQAFGEITRYLLDRQLGGSKMVELVNAAVSGYSSEQIVRWLTSRGWAYEPDVILLYCGNNDASVSGTVPDRVLLDSQKLGWLRSGLSHFALYRVMRGLLVSAPGEDGADSGKALAVRVSPERFGENLRDIAGQCRRHQCPLVILKPPVPYLWPAGLQFKPFLHLTGDHGTLILPPRMAEILGRETAYCISPERFEELYGRGDVFTREVYRSAFGDTLLPDKAVEYYTKLASEAPDNSLYLNNLGVALWRTGEYARADTCLKRGRDAFLKSYGTSQSPAVAASASPLLYNIGVNLLSQSEYTLDSPWDTGGPAFTYLDSALQADYFSLRIKRPYWQEIDSLRGAPGVTVIDLPRLFSENGGERLFIDHCHPTAEGHQLIARAILEVLGRGLR